MIFFFCHETKLTFAMNLFRDEKLYITINFILW